MLHMLKAKMIERKIAFLVGNALKYSQTDDEYLLQLHLTGVEELYYDWYNEVLKCKLYSKEVKKEALWFCRVMTDMLNEWRFENHCVA